MPNECSRSKAVFYPAFTLTLPDVARVEPREPPTSFWKSEAR